MPITPAAELRDQPVTWVREMLPVYSESCNNSTGRKFFLDSSVDFVEFVFTMFSECEQQGWSILEFTSLASAGYWKSAWDNVDRLDPALYETAGGNGHSRSNTLWYIATRPSLAEVVENEEEFEEEERAKADNEVHI